MILAIDVFYRETSACTAGILFKQWEDFSFVSTHTSIATEINEYVSGEFYKRELPCILQLLQEHQLEPDIIIVDGYVYLDGHSKPGLGKYLYDALDGKVPIVGVAKSPFARSSAINEVLRGKSHKPIYVSCVGIKLEDVVKNIHLMHGTYRIPKLLKNADQLCRGLELSP